MLSVRWKVVASLVAVALVAALPTAAGADAAVPACPTPNTAAMDCAVWWNVMYPRPAAEPVVRSDLMRTVVATLVRAGVALHAPEANLFVDDDGHPDELAIAELAAAGVVHGRSSDTVEPDALASRAQLAAVAVRAAELVLGTAVVSTGSGFRDTAGSTHREAIEKAHALGLVLGTDATRFGPDDPATQGQLALVITRLLGVLVTRGILDAPLSTGSFDVTVVPAVVRDTIPGQRLVLLVTLGRDRAPSAGPADLAVSAPGAATSAGAATVAHGQVVEVTVVPQPGGGHPGSPEAWIPLTVTASRGTDRHRVVVPVRVVPGEDTISEEAAEILGTWVPWLAQAHPELGIGPSTAWMSTITKPNILVVSHYLFFSSEWELGLMWHVMIPPHNWTEIYLRRRSELAPTYAFRLDSRTDPAALPHDVEPPTEIDR